MKSTRLYRIARRGADETTPVRAANREQALRHVARSLLSATIATDDDIYEWGKRGAKIEDATADKETE